ncbi:hypothetical protein B0T22DRAFT_496170 [Podospora appendiculata]|uniref:Nudix hydrolase domain-containing protein n=1 Tax=Podospora appendiculata TaxID=314037 RepID=A0AAE0XHH5_9PEZI|nr:hypothetical protein B0T22DRAFT_496170 [Podospora appendiculata]
MSTTSSPSASAKDLQPKKKTRPAPTPVCPSSSILLLSHTNQVLALHRVQTSSSFASAHVFPGGNISPFHDGALPDLQSLDIHQDSEVYRLAAVRETFEESGILLVRKAGAVGLLDVPEHVREAGRKEVHANRIKFTDWLESVGGVADTEGLIPFTRWVTPLTMPKRFSTQMYIYMLPLSSEPAGGPKQEFIIHTPTHDGGLEHTAATFEHAATWLDKARAGDIILYPPQYYLLHLVSQFTQSTRPNGPVSAYEYYQNQREALVSFLKTTPTVRPGVHTKTHPTAEIPWADKIMSPTSLFVRRSDKRLVLGLDKPGPELKETKRGGDWDRVVLVNFSKDGPRYVEVRWRDDVLREEREGEGVESGAAKL